MSYKKLLDNLIAPVIDLKQAKLITIAFIPNIPFEVGICFINTSWQAGCNDGTILSRSLASLTGTLKGAWQKANWYVTIVMQGDCYCLGLTIRIVVL